MFTMRRVRGLILRLVRRRALSVALGLALAVPAAYLELIANDVSWWVDGLSLVVGATGLALVWSGLTGVRPDWVDD